MSPSKSRSGEAQKEGEYDRISSLPDDVLCHILSLLPTKYYVSTTVLSARWKNLFASVPDLNLDDSMTGTKTLDASLFNLFVSKVLLEVLKKLSHVRKFRLKCARGPCCASLVSLWMSAATGCSTLQLQELLIYIEKLNTPVFLPPELFSCQTLTTLNLKGTFVLCVPGPVILPTLKSLELSKVILSSEESVKNLLCGCIVLDNLYFSDCVTKHIDVLEVSGNYLKELRLDCMNGDYNFVIDAPCLEFFYCESYANRGYYGNNLYSLEKAVVDLMLEDEHFEEEKVSQLVNMVSRARSLTLSGDAMEALTKPNHTLVPFY